MRSDPPAARGARIRGAGAGEEGSAVVDFALVGALVVAVALGLHVRNVLIDAAGEGARRAALVGGTTAEAEARVRALAGAALSEDCVQAVEVRRIRAGGLAVVEVRVAARLPVLGLLGPGGGLVVTGHAVDEAALADPPGAGRG